ncbi:MAG: A24 family peptidase [Clostridiales bacterium]|jgi:prepilin peptidase CpaA|nr:A24 family peptidase [Eubacteriales bacterium]MDH7566303.1 A24 family peptidase [Clostridiales bacterium]
MYLLTVKVLEVILLLAAAAKSDCKTYKIKNSITLSFMLVGAATNIYAYGIEGLKLSLLGWGLPVALLFILYALRMLGAGDIKLFGAIGAIMGYKFAFYSIAYSFVCGGVMGVILLVIRHNAGKRFHSLLTYVKSSFLMLKPMSYSEFGDKTGGDKFHFSFAVLAGTLIHLLSAAVSKGGFS